MLLVRNAALLPAGDFPGTVDLLAVDGRIAAIEPAGRLNPQDARVLDAAGLLLTPGFIDLQINGAFGHDFTQDPASIWEAAARLPRYGVSAFLPTIITSPPAAIRRAIEALHRGPPPGFNGALPLGLHLEGPFLNPQKRGAHPPGHLQLPDPELAAEWTPENGVRMVTLAPELPGALELVRRLAGRGVVVSAGHSLAGWEQARAAFAAGVTCGTHIFNAMPPLDHRNPGLVEAILLDPAIRFGLIADGVHLHPAAVRLAWETAGAGRLFLVSDATAALGMPPGEYDLGGQAIRVDGAAPRLPDGRLAGSILQPDQAVRNLLRFTGCSVTQAVEAITRTPAGVLRHPAAPGVLAPGLPAGFTLLTSDLRVAATVVAGQVCHLDLPDPGRDAPPVE